MPQADPLRAQVLVPAAGIPACGPSGASAHARGISAGLAALGHDVELFAAAERDARGFHEAPAVPWTATGVASWPKAPRAIAHLREWRTARGVARAALAASRRGPPVDLLLERHALYSDAGAWLQRRGLPWVLEVDAPLALERKRYDGGLVPSTAARWEHRTLRAAPHIVAVSAWLRDWLVSEHGCEPHRVQHLPNGTAGLAGDRARGRAMVELGEEAWVLGFVGAFRAWHGLELLPRLLDALPEARLLLVGAGRAGEEALWRPLAAHPRVVMAGRRSQAELAHLVAAMDLGLAPYAADAPPWFCPLKVLDYRAQGTPVLASDIGDCRHLVGEAGSVVAAGDLDAMVAAAEAWRGRRCAPSVRGWDVVARELVEGAASAARAVAKPPPPG